LGHGVKTVPRGHSEGLVAKKVIASQDIIASHCRKEVVENIGFPIGKRKGKGEEVKREGAE
jgi:hypothetical protein